MFQERQGICSLPCGSWKGLTGPIVHIFYVTHTAQSFWILFGPTSPVNHPSLTDGCRIESAVQWFYMGQRCQLINIENSTITPITQAYFYGRDMPYNLTFEIPLIYFILSDAFFSLRHYLSRNADSRETLKMIPNSGKIKLMVFTA